MMQFAKRCDIIELMHSHERMVPKNNRLNLVLLREACGLKTASARGSQRYLARIINTSETHLSDLIKGKRGLGDELKGRIEKAFSLPPDWLDREHPSSDVAQLANSVPLLPSERKVSTSPGKPQPHTALEKSLLERVERLERIASDLAKGRNTPK